MGSPGHAAKPSGPGPDSYVFLEPDITHHASDTISGPCGLRDNSCL